MIVQPLVENAIKHGTSQITGIGQIAIDIVLSAAGLRISVSDNGPGFPSGFTLTGSGAGHGLRNVADRLRGYYGDGGTLQWQNSSVGPSTIVTIEIPRERLPQCAS
jgi:LytS/YehU family sensor histidine kinase